jgi:hypothetical protein
MTRLVLSSDSQPVQPAALVRGARRFPIFLAPIVLAPLDAAASFQRIEVWRAAAFVLTATMMTALDVHPFLIIA